MRLQETENILIKMSNMANTEIKDPNIIIEDTTKKKTNKITYQVIIAKLQTAPKTSQCGAKF